jgi:hypothetical protein
MDPASHPGDASGPPTVYGERTHEGDILLTEIEACIQGICAHVPGLAPAVPAVTNLSHGDIARGDCCEGWRPVEPLPAPQTRERPGSPTIRAAVLPGTARNVPGNLRMPRERSRGQDWQECHRGPSHAICASVTLVTGGQGGRYKFVRR